jgi:hypothetical protein
MNTIENIGSKRKIIDLDENTFRILSVKAAMKGTNLKRLIESSLRGMADDIEDSELYAFLVKEYPGGKKTLNSQEKDNFETWLGV